MKYDYDHKQMKKDLDKYYNEDSSEEEDHSDWENWSESDWSE